MSRCSKEDTEETWRNESTELVPQSAEAKARKRRRRSTPLAGFSTEGRHGKEPLGKRINVELKV